ncbi:polyketide antibiotic transporter [Nocardia sp. bgisy134]|uniref:polyketide antibiotic transporter n=1 Tax=unclassified Nocardia TaxID=2637762 RepID=UPI003D763F66
MAVTAAGMSALVAGQYQTTFADAIDTDAIHALAENPAIRVLFGTPRALDDPGGFTVWRTGTPVLVLSGVWALLAATRVTRGEEDAGRWDLLLGGAVRAVDLLVRCLVTFAMAALLIATGVGMALILTGTDPAGAIVHAFCVFGTVVVFSCAGLFAAQLLPSRAAAAGFSGAVLGVCLLLRMLADGVSEVAWTAWVTPFGLVARAAPYAGNRYEPLLVLVAVGVAFAVAALAAARNRDLGGALIVLPATRPARTRLLGSMSAFALRRAVMPTMAWSIGIATYFLLIGALISSILEFFEGNARFAELAASAGFAGLDSATGFAAALFGLLAIPVGLYCATRLAAMGADEKARRWTVLHALPVPRCRIAAAEVAVTAAGSFVLLITAAVAMWSGAALTGAPLGIDAALAGAINVAPIALLGLGAAMLALGWYPAAVGPVGALPVAGGFLLDVIARSIRAPAWLINVSPFAHLSAVPDTGPAWVASLVLLAIAAILTAIGLLGYTCRDLDT